MPVKRLKLAGMVERLSELAVRKAYRRALASGSKVLVSEDGVLYEVAADGSRKAVKRIEPPVAVTKGQKYQIG